MVAKPPFISQLEAQTGATLTRLEDKTNCPAETQWARANSYALNEKGELITLNLKSINLKAFRVTRDLARLKKLDLSKNAFTQIHFETDLDELELLNLSYNSEDMDLLQFNKSFNQLQYLYIHQSKIKVIQFKQNLPALYDLNLSHNQLESLEFPPDFNCPEIFNIEENEPLKNLVPADVLNADAAAIINYFTKSIARKKLRQVKMLLLGNPNVGKSWLSQYLEDGSLPTTNEPTHGIRYKEIKMGDKEELTLHCWDFGGQEYFHATHKLFFSANALNLVLWSKEDQQRNTGEEEKCFEKKYWLRCIEQLSDFRERRHKVVLAENKIDLNEYCPSPVNQQELSLAFPELNFHYYAMSLAYKKRLKGLEELVYELAESLVQEHIAQYEKYIEKIKTLKSDTAKIKDLKLRKEEDAEVISAMKVLHNMGMLLYFENIIPDKVFIQPQALLDLLYKKILSKEKRSSITIDNITNAIHGNSLGLKTEQIIALLQHFDLAFQIEEKSDTFFIPQYLPEAPPLIDFFKKHQFRQANLLIEADNYLMSLAMLKLFAAYGKNVKRDNHQENNLFWKNGLIIEKNNQLLMVGFNRESQSLLLYPDLQHDNFELQNEIVQFILNLEENRNVRIQKTEAEGEEILDFTMNRKGMQIGRYKESGAVADDRNWQSNSFTVNISLDGYYFARYNDLVNHREFYKIETRTILHTPEALPPTQTLSVFDFNKYLPLSKRGLMKKIFISYSKADLQLVDQFIDHLSALQIDGKVAHWYCTDLLPGADWEKEIKAHFDDADMVCFMISPNFMRTRYIHEIEIPRAFERKKKDKDFQIVPIYLDFCSWKTQTHDLSQYNALPYSLKPVMDFENRNKAWYIIQACLRKIIEDQNQEAPQGPDFYQWKLLPEDVKSIFREIKKGD